MQIVSARRESSIGRNCGGNHNQDQPPQHPPNIPAMAQHKRGFAAIIAGTRRCGSIKRLKNGHFGTCSGVDSAPMYRTSLIQNSASRFVAFQGFLSSRGRYGHERQARPPFPSAERRAYRTPIAPPTGLNSQLSANKKRSGPLRARAFSITFVAAQFAAIVKTVRRPQERIRGCRSHGL